MYKFLFLALSLSSVAAHAVEIKETKRAIYIMTPYNELQFPEQAKAVKEVRSVIIQELQRMVPTNRVTATAFKALSSNEDELSQLIKDANDWAQTAGDTVGLRKETLIPSGFIIFLGGKFTADFKVGGGAAGMIGAVIQPTKVEVIDKISKTVVSYYSTRFSIVGIPSLNIGGGIGGGAALRVGFGLIWGKMKNPEEFKGMLYGVTGNLNLAVGNNFKLGVVTPTLISKVSHVVFLASFDAGPSAEATIHGSVARILPLQDLLQLMGVTSGEQQQIETPAKPEAFTASPLVLSAFHKKH